MMSFLRWICETYLAKRRKGGKRKTVNQYWREFKMLHRRVNGCPVDANDSSEVVKVLHSLSIFSSHHTLTFVIQVHQHRTEGRL
jgi:hypothetical protein